MKVAAARRGRSSKQLTGSLAVEDGRETLGEESVDPDVPPVTISSLSSENFGVNRVPKLEVAAARRGRSSKRLTSGLAVDDRRDCGWMLKRSV